MLPTGIGLLFLIARNLLDEARDGNAVLFALTVLTLSVWGCGRRNCFPVGVLYLERVLCSR